MAKKRINEIKSYNSRLVSLFLFQYSLLIPIMTFISPTVIIAGSGIIILIGLFLLNNRLTLNSRITVFYLIMLSIICCKIVFVQGTSIQFLVVFLIYAIPPGIMMLYEFDKWAFLRDSFILSYINFFINFLDPFMPYYNYMRFGYGMILTSIFLYIRIVYFKKEMNRGQFYFCGFILLSSVMEVFLYGARGSLLVYIIFITTDIFIIGKKRVFRNNILLIFICIIVANIKRILMLFLAISKKIGIYSYSLTKYLMQLDKGWEYASSGRGLIYADAMEKIKAHPFIGNPVQSGIVDGNYAHNLFLQVGLDLGIGGIIVTLLFIIFSIILLATNRLIIEEKIVLAALFSISVGRLLVSSTLWERPEFWMYVCYIISISNRKHQFSKLHT